MRVLLWVGGVGIALTLAACDDDTVYTPPHVHPPPSGEELPPDPVPDEELLLVRAAECEYTARCTPKGLGMYPGGDLEGCLNARVCSAVSPGWRSHLVDFDACLESLRSGPCEEVALPGKWSSFQSPSPCATRVGDFSAHYLGKPGLGEPCQARFDEFPCSEGWCRIEPMQQSGEQICGVCTAPLAEGDPCTEADRCGGETRCLEGVCRALLQNGESCSSDEQCYRNTCLNGQCAYPAKAEPPPNYGERLGEPCNYNTACGYYDPTLDCIGGVCVPSPDLGEPCDDLQDCRIGLGCHEGICEEVPCVVDLGGFCGDSLICSTPDSLCDETGHCAKMPAEGEPCGDWVVECGNGLLCDRATDHCIRPPPLRPLGSPCTLSDLAPVQCELSTLCQRDPTCDANLSDADCGGICTARPERVCQ